jgi:cytochrome P450
MSNAPANPIEAVTHPDPYPFYEKLAPIYYDKNLAMWIAASAETVTSVLTSNLCRVRPLEEPVPKSLIGSPADEIFGHLVRMNDGAVHCPFKQAINGAIDRIELGAAEKEAEKWARVIAGDIKPRGINDIAFRLPVYTMASLLGFAPDELSQIADWTGEFVACLAAGASSDQIEKGNKAAVHLLDSFRRLLQCHNGGLLSKLAEMAGGRNEEIIIANGIGCLSQAYEATAGLIGNTMVALSKHKGLGAETAILPEIVSEVNRFDPSVQNTRRFVVNDGPIAGREMKAGDAVLVVLAAANRDPAVNPNPNEFDIFRENRRSFTFGVGPHACPGERLAMGIATAGVRQLLESGIEPGRLKAVYSKSVNTRIPLFI